LDRRKFLVATSGAVTATGLAAAADSRLVTPIQTPVSGIIDIGGTRHDNSLALPERYGLSASITENSP